MILKSYFDNASLSVDRISFSTFIIGNTSEKEFFKALTDIGFGKCEYDSRNRNNKRKYKRVRKYIVENSVIEFLYKRRNDARFLPNIWCTFQDPTRPIINLLDSLCNSFGFVTKVSHIELTVDFDYCPKLHKFFQKYLFLKRNRGTSCFEGIGITKSYYSGHKAKNSKTTIVYQKFIDGANRLRFELRLSRKVIKGLNLDLRLDGVNNIDLRQFFCFRKFNREKFIKYREGKHKAKLAEMSPLTKSLYLRLLRDVELAPYVMLLISHLKQKGYLHPQRFLEDMPKTNREFYKLVQGKQFLREQT